jgi:guanylate kinase
VAAPSGTGKTTVCRRVMERDERLRFSISHTTRRPREGERDGVDYYFVAPRVFREMVEAGAFVEHAEYAGNLYGTSWRALEEPLEQGFDLLLEIEVQGARQVRERRDDVCFIFLLPPSLEELALRLRKRGTDDPDAIERRLAVADRELAAAEIFDFAVVNDDLATAVSAVLEIIGAVREGRGAELRARYGRAEVLERWQRRADPHP